MLILLHKKSAVTTQCHLDKVNVKNRVYRNMCPVLFYVTFQKVLDKIRQI